MPIRDDLYRKVIAEREAAENKARSADLRRWLVVLGVCILWQLAGGALVVFAFHTQMNHKDALEIVWGGFGLAAAGTALTVAVLAPRNARGE